MIYEREPSEQQRRIIEEPDLDLPLKIVAGAGTGKTFVLAHRFAWLVVEQGIPADHILALTFNDNAATEMRTRIRKLLRLNVERGEASPSDPHHPPTTTHLPPSLWVHTFHSFAARVLREQAYAAGRNPEPRLVTEIEEARYLDDLLEAVFSGDFREITALAPERLAEAGVEKPDELRRMLRHLVREAKSRGLLPEDFRAEAQEQTERFWASVPPAAEVQGLSKEEARGLLVQRLTGRDNLGLGSSTTDPRAAALNDVLKLYFQSLVPKFPAARPEAQALLDRAQWAELALIDAATHVYRQYRELLGEGAIDFDGQIMQAVELLRDEKLGLSRQYREQFQYLLVDEFQDTSPLQLELVRRLARPREVQVRGAGGRERTVAAYARLLVVGDQKQSIYGWRQARPENVNDLLDIRAGETVAGAEVCRPLTESYRLTPPVVEVANRAGAAARPEDPPLVAMNPAEGRVIYPEVFLSDRGPRYTRREEAAFIAAQIEELRQAGAIADLSEAAVLIRSRSRFRPLKVACERRGLLYQAQGGVGFFEHPLARDVLAWLQLLRDPQQDLYLARLLTREPYGLSDRALYLLLTRPDGAGRQRREGSGREIVGEFLEDYVTRGAGFLARAGDGDPAGARAGKPAPRGPEELAEIPAPRLQAFAEQYATLREVARQADAGQVVEAVWRHCQQHVRLTPSEERATGVVRATFQGVIAELAGDEPVHLDDLVATLDRYLADDYRELPVADQPVRGAVQVMTIHRAKGLGFTAVFLLGWNEPGGSGPSYDEKRGVRGIHVGGQDAKGIICKFLDRVSGEAKGADVGDPDDESLRLAYVGVTRAKRFLCVTRAAGKKGTPHYPAESYFAGVDEIPAQVPATPDHSGPLVRPCPAPAPPPREPRAPELLRVSFTGLRRLEQCPHAWLLHRQAPGGWEPAAESAGGAEVGSRFHRFVAAHYRGRPAEAETEGLEAAEAARLRGLVTAFRASEWARPAEAAQAEVPVTLARRAGGATVLLGGVVDLLLAESGRVVDFKTERRMTPERRADHALQMLIYREALSAGGQPAPQAVIVHATPEGMETVALSEEEIAAQAPRLERLLGELVALAAGKPAEARHGEHCQWCVFREMCAGE